MLSLKQNEFFQDGPVLGNQYEDDVFLRNYLRHTLPPHVLEVLDPECRELGGLAVEKLLALSKEVELNPPTHVPYDEWGKRVDRVLVSPAWSTLGRVATKYGLVATAYEGEHDAFARIVQFAKVYLFSASSALYTCPLAMSDGAARVLTLYGDDDLKKRFLRRLVSRSSAHSWTSGQWMTEHEGGSDVSKTSTIALPEDEVNGTYRLFGTKWFTSSITSPMAMALARISGDLPGNRGLSLFAVELRDHSGNLQNITINRLKDKLGTKGVPTAEITLEGTHARLVGKRCSGVSQVTAMLNITRLWNSVEAVAVMRRAIALVRNYATKRSVFGEPLIAKPAFLEVLADMEMELRGAFLLAFYVAELTGKEEAGSARVEESALLRLLTPVAKLFTAKQAVRVTSEAVECFGGAGYIEDTYMPKLLRDAQVLPIWEGPTNVLALDVLRVLEKTEAPRALHNFINVECGRGTEGETLRSFVANITKASHTLTTSLELLKTRDSKERESVARSYAFMIGSITVATLFVRHIRHCEKSHQDDGTCVALARWIARGSLLGALHPADQGATRNLALGR